MSNDQRKGIVLPSWVWPVVVAITSIIGSTLWAMNFLDGRYASKEDVVSVSNKVDDMDKHVLNIENILMRHPK